jgi:hypothetical protein
MVTPFDPDKIGDPNVKKGRRGRRGSNVGNMNVSPQRGGNVGGASVGASQELGYGYDLGYGAGSAVQDTGFAASPYGGGGGGFNDIGDNQYGGGGYDQRPGGARGRR